MIQDSFPHRLDTHYSGAVEFDDNCFLFLYRGKSILLKSDVGRFVLPRKSDFSTIEGIHNSTYIFTMDGVPCFVAGEIRQPDHPSFAFTDLSFFRTTTQKDLAWAAMVGYQLHRWYIHNKFCGTCGTPTEKKHGDRALVCPGCQRVVFPHIHPAIIAAVISDDEILLVRGTKSRGQWYSLIAGYVEIGETPEEAVVREVMEEVGLEVKNIRYCMSQPWPLSSSLMAGFVAQASPDKQLHIDKKEIVEAAWFPRHNLPKYSSTMSIAGKMIECFERGTLRG